MNRIIAGLLSCTLLLSCSPSLQADEPIVPPLEPDPCITSTGGFYKVRFSPSGGCTDLLVETILGAKRTIHVQAYSFTSDRIANALVSRHRQGVTVEVILDSSDRYGRSSQLQTLIEGGVPTFIDDRHSIAHNKVVIVDGRQVETGSFNFTGAAEKSNAENCLVLTDIPGLAPKYEKEWQKHKAHSELP